MERRSQRLAVLGCTPRGFQWKMKKNISEQFNLMARHFRIYLPIKYIKQICESTAYTWQSPEQEKVWSQAPTCKRDEGAVVVDKRCQETPSYEFTRVLYRMYTEFVEDSQYFEEVRGYSVEHLCAVRGYIASRLLKPKIVPRHDFNDSHVPQAYHKYKGKCAGAISGLQCSKSHAHTREIISDFCNPLKPVMRKVARAIRVINSSVTDLLGLCGNSQT